MAWAYQGAFHSAWQNDMRVEVRYYFGDQNIENNTTQILSETYLQTRNSRWIDANFTGASLAGTWGGSQTKQHQNPGNQTTYFTGYSRTVTHNADGTISTIFGGSLRTNNVIAFDQAISQWFLLPTIPRATTPSLVGGGGFVTGSSKTISLPRASSNFTHDVTYSFRGLTGTIATGAGVSTTWTPPHELMQALPNATSANVTITVVTKQGSTTVGSKTAQYSLAAAASIIPTVTGVSWFDTNPTVSSNIGALVQGLSAVRGSVSATGAQGSTISERRLRISNSTVPENTAVQLNSSGTISARGEAVDSRGRLGTLTSNLSVLPYLPPRLGSGSWQVQRADAGGAPDDSGERLRLDLHALVNSLVVGGSEKNSLQISVRTRPTGGGWTNRNTINPGLSYNSDVLITGGAVFLTSQSYEVEITLSDQTGSEPTRLSTTIPTAGVTLDLKGNSVGIGKYHEQGVLDVGPGGIYDNGVRTTGYDLQGSPVASDIPSTYPVGLSRQRAGNDPTIPHHWGFVITDKTEDNRAFQLNVGQNADRIAIRAATTSSGSDSWQPWRDLATVVGPPTGSVMPFAGSSAPQGWFLAQGQTISRTTYAGLFAVIGTTYGAGNGSTTFHLPDLRGKVPVGLSVTELEFRYLNDRGGAKSHTLTTAQMPSHTHTQNAHTHPQNITANAGGTAVRNDYTADARGVPYNQGANTNATVATNQNTGGGGAHNNLQPYITLNYIIKV